MPLEWQWVQACEVEPEPVYWWLMMQPLRRVVGTLRLGIQRQGALGRFEGGTMSEAATSSAANVAAAATKPIQSKVGKYVQEIQAMMYTFGDVRNPSADTAEFIEDVVHAQLVDIVLEILSFYFHYYFEGFEGSNARTEERIQEHLPGGHGLCHSTRCGQAEETP